MLLGLKVVIANNLFCTSYLSRCFTYIQFALEPCQVGTVIVPILQGNRISLFKFTQQTMELG